MNISEKKKNGTLYGNKRTDYEKKIAVKQSKNVLGNKNAKDIDDILYHLERDIWKDVLLALNISGS